MKKFWFIKEDFHKTRSNKIGASDIPAIIANPEKPNESLSGYGRTPLTVWEEKTGKLKRESAGRPAEIGHFIENKTIELFLKEFEFPEKEIENLQYKIIAEMDREYLDEKQDSMFKYHTQYYTNHKIAHPDSVYIPAGNSDMKKIEKNRITIDLTKPFILEAKSATYFSAKRPGNSLISGYDFSLKTWQGIPLKHYMQIQFQLMLFDIDIAYLALISNTSEFHVWEIKANKSHQEEINKTVDGISHCIKNNIPPREYIFNQEDIKSLYPNIKNDFLMLTGKENEEQINNIVEQYKKAILQEKKWKEKETEALDAMSIVMSDHKELRDKNGIIACWQERKGSEKIISLKEIRDLSPQSYLLLQKNNLIKTTKNSRYIVIK